MISDPGSLEAAAAAAGGEAFIRALIRTASPFLFILVEAVKRACNNSFIISAGTKEMILAERLGY